MAITELTALNTTAEVAASSSTGFTTTGPFVLYGDDFGNDEHAKLLRLGPNGSYSIATNEKGEITVGDYPNFVYIDAAGFYRVSKMATASAVSVGYEEQ